jgi:hypothetical protein
MPNRPLDCPRPGSHPFEVIIYNRQVRALLKENETHPDFGDRWADQMRQMVEAVDADEAKALAARRYPPEAGFVIASVRELGRDH